MANWEDRRTIREPLPPTEEEQALFDAWKVEYEKLEAIGEDNGWLQIVPYEGQYVNAPRPAGYTERLETDEEYGSRMASPFARQVWEVNQMMFKTIKDRLTLPMPTAQEATGNVVFPVKKRGES